MFHVLADNKRLASFAAFGEAKGFIENTVSPASYSKIELKAGGKVWAVWFKRRDSWQRVITERGQENLEANMIELK